MDFVKEGWPGKKHLQNKDVFYAVGVKCSEEKMVKAIKTKYEEGELFDLCIEYLKGQTDKV